MGDSLTVTSPVFYPPSDTGAGAVMAPVGGLGERAFVLTRMTKQNPEQAPPKTGAVGACGLGREKNEEL